MESSTIPPEKEKQRTLGQNNSLHKFCEMLAQELNSAGISQPMFLKNLEIDHSKESIKSVFREIGKKKYGKISTGELTTKEITDIYDEINRHTSTSFGIHVPFPSYQAVADEELIKKSGCSHYHSYKCANAAHSIPGVGAMFKRLRE